LRTGQGSLSRRLGIHFRLPPTTLLHCRIVRFLVLPQCSPCSPSALPCALSAPSVLPLKQPCSPSRPKKAITNPKFGVYIIYIYIIYTPNLGFEIAVLGREREQRRFRGSSEGAWGSTGEHRGSTEAQQASRKGAAREERFWLLKEPNLAALYSATAALVFYPAVLPGSACYWFWNRSLK